jgi:hypothetical protein
MRKEKKVGNFQCNPKMLLEIGYKVHLRNYDKWQNEEKNIRI